MVYIGRRRQAGSGLGAAIFKSLFRAAMPVVKSVGKNVGREILKTGAKAGIAIASDALAGRDIKTATKRRASKAALSALEKGIKAIRGPSLASHPPATKKARRAQQHIRGAQSRGLKQHGSKNPKSQNRQGPKRQGPKKQGAKRTPVDIFS